MAAEGYGISLARAPATDGREQALGLQRCLEGLELAGTEAYYLVARSFSSLSPSARRFWEWLLDATAQYR